jgi:serine/threonine protein kinase/DNA-binding SARP family transcriptional activator
MDVRLTTLGAPGVVVNGEESVPLAGKPLPLCLLVFLGLEREATRDRLQGVFWPDSPPDRARRALTQTLHDLKKELGEAWVESRGQLVRATPRLWIDALEFEALAESGRHPEALALYAGPFLDGVSPARGPSLDEWVELRRARLARRHRAASDAFIAEARKRGDLQGALWAAEKWATLDHLDDAAQHHLIRLLAETGSRSEALAQFERYEANLRELLGLEPLEETRALVEWIREGSSPASPPPFAPGSIVPESSQATPGPAPPDPGKIRGRRPRREELARRMDEELGGSLQILRPIGRGNVADVFLAREPHLKRLVAVKILATHLASDPKARKRFQREARAAARINHPNVCAVYQVGTLSDGTPFYILPFVKGTTLGQRLKAEGRLPPSEVRRVIRDVASALAAAHRLSVIHRDVRPDNVLADEESGRYYLCDFGIAGVLETGEEGEERITSTGEVLGHPAYMSPEQTAGEPLTDRADVYSLGVMAHELLMGRVPQPGKASERKASKVPPPPDLEPLWDHLGVSDPDMVDLITRCLAPNPAHRPSAGDIERKCEERAKAQEGWWADALTSRWAPTRALFERRLPQMLLASILASWGIFEFSKELVERGHLPEITETLILMTIPFGLLAVSILGWFHGKKGPQEMPLVEKLLLGLLALGWVVGLCWVLLSAERQGLPMVPSAQESKASGPKASHTAPSDVLINLGRSLKGAPSNRDGAPRPGTHPPIYPKEEHHGGCQL